jgi:hypothetical protein
MPEKPETKLHKKMMARLRERGAWVTKIHGGIYSSGVPDLLVCYLGYFVALEVKLPSNRSKATALQAAQLRQIRASGGYGYVVRSIRDVERILGAIDKRREHEKRALLGTRPR